MKKVNIVGIGGSGMSYHRHDVVAVEAVCKIEKSYKKVEQMCKFTEKSDKAFFRGFKHRSK